MSDETRSIEISEHDLEVLRALADVLAARGATASADVLLALLARWDAAPRPAEPACDVCGHEWRRHDPEDGECDAHSNERFSVCQCGRDLAWMRVRIAALSRAALDDGGEADA